MTLPDFESLVLSEIKKIFYRKNVKVSRYSHNFFCSFWDENGGLSFKHFLLLQENAMVLCMIIHHWKYKKYIIPLPQLNSSKLPKI